MRARRGASRDKVLNAVLAGYSRPEAIARRAKLKLGQVRNHLSRLYQQEKIARKGDRAWQAPPKFLLADYWKGNPCAE